MNGIWLLGAVFFGAFLVYGLASGRMPAKGAFYIKATQPRWYWACGAVYAAFIGYFLYEAFTPP